MKVELIKNPKVIHDKGLILLPLKDEHKSLVYKIVSNKVLRDRIEMDVLDDPELFNEWWDKRMTALQDLKLLHWVVFLEEGNEFCGLLTLKEIEISSKRGEIGYSFLPKFWGQGIGSKAVKLIFDFAMKEIQFHSLFAQVLEVNIPSQRILQKLGFEKEGHFKDCYFHNGSYFNILQYGVINSLNF